MESRPTEKNYAGNYEKMQQFDRSWNLRLTNRRSVTNQVERLIAVENDSVVTRYKRLGRARGSFNIVEIGEYGLENGEKVSVAFRDSARAIGYISRRVVARCRDTEVELEIFREHGEGISAKITRVSDQRHKHRIVVLAQNPDGSVQITCSGEPLLECAEWHLDRPFDQLLGERIIHGDATEVRQLGKRDKLLITRANRLEAHRSESMWKRAASHGVCPRLYAHEFIVKNSSVYKMVVTEAMESLTDTLGHAVIRSLDSPVKIRRADRHALRDLLCDLYRRIANMNVTCIDTKPGNTVVQIREGRIVAARAIDWDTDLCARIPQDRTAEFEWLMKAQMALILLFTYGVNPLYKTFRPIPEHVMTCWTWHSADNNTSHSTKIQHYLAGTLYEEFVEKVVAHNNPKDLIPKDYSPGGLVRFVQMKDLQDAWAFFTAGEV